MPIQISTKDENEDEKYLSESSINYHVADNLSDGELKAMRHVLAGVECALMMNKFSHRETRTKRYSVSVIASNNA